LAQSRESWHCTQPPVKVVSQIGVVPEQLALVWHVTQTPGAMHVPPGHMVLLVQ
jgi:hypothetical protein